MSKIDIFGKPCRSLRILRIFSQILREFAQTFWSHWFNVRVRGASSPSTPSSAPIRFRTKWERPSPRLAAAQGPSRRRWRILLQQVNVHLFHEKVRNQSAYLVADKFFLYRIIKSVCIRKVRRLISISFPGTPIKEKNTLRVIKFRGRVPDRVRCHGLCWSGAGGREEEA